MGARGENDELRCALPAVPESVAALRRRAREFASRHGAAEQLRHAIALAVTEAATNAVVHAYRDRDVPGPIVLRMRREDARLEILVSDEGGGPVPRPDSPGMGVGLPLISTLAEDVSVTRCHGTCVKMRFALG